MKSEFPAPFAQNYQCLLNRLKLHGLQPKTIKLYSHGVRLAGAYFGVGWMGLLYFISTNPVVWFPVRHCDDKDMIIFLGVHQLVWKFV